MRTSGLCTRVLSWRLVIARRFQVTDLPAPKTHSIERLAAELDELARHAPARLVLPYTAAMLAALLFMPGPRRTLMLGLGGASQARFLRHHFPDARVTAWESDARAIALARRHFSLSADDGGTHIINDDARAAVASHEYAADLVLMDLFGAHGPEPWVRDRALHDNCRRTLTPEGVLVANLWVDNDDETLSVMSGIEAAFEKRTLLLTLPGYRNHVVLAFNGRPCLDLARLRERALRLGARTSLDFEKMIDRMRHSNRSDAAAFIL